MGGAGTAVEWGWVSATQRGGNKDLHREACRRGPTIRVAFLLRACVHGNGEGPWWLSDGALGNKGGCDRPKDHGAMEQGHRRSSRATT